MKKEIKIKILKDDGYYVASGINAPVVTQAETMPELLYNIKEVIELYLEDEDLEELDIEPMPTVSMNIKLEEMLCPR